MINGLDGLSGRFEFKPIAESLSQIKVYADRAYAPLA